MSVIEFAAWTFLGKTIGELISGRRRRTEFKAVKAEFQDHIDAEYNVDESQPLWKQQQDRERHRERQRRLLMRYPNVLVAPPDWKYFKRIEQEEKDAKVPFKENLKENWKWWLCSALVCLAVYMFGGVVKAVWKSLMN